jgi:hypothetical protein
MRIPGIAAGTLIVPVQAHSHAHGDTMYTYTYLLTRRGSSRTGPVQCACGDTRDAHGSVPSRDDAHGDTGPVQCACTGYQGCAWECAVRDEPRRVSK